MSTPLNHKSTLKSPSERARFKAHCLSQTTITWQEKPEQYCEYRLDGQYGTQWCRIKQYQNGTCYVEASSSELMQQLTGENGTAKTASSNKPGGQAPTENIRGKLDIVGPYIGTDESGKGDYFGPLVIAGVYVTPETSAQLQAIGIMDSKQLTEIKIKTLSAKLLDIVDQQSVSVIEISPNRYNELYDSFKSKGKNLNHLLAWGHAKVIENLLTQQPGCTQVIADQFGDERYIRSQLQERGKQITLYQTPKAEANLGVAAASVLARARFVSKVKHLSTQFDVTLPFGANPQVKAAAKALIAHHGRQALSQVAKLHFKTTQEL